MKVVKKIWPFIFLLVVYISGTINSIVHGILENKIVYNFQITKIEHTPTNQLIFYDGENEITLWNYTFMRYDDVKLGDYLIKEKYAEFAYIKRKNKNGKLIEIVKTANTSYFANMICN